MSYLNNQVGYRDELLMTRSVVKKDNYVLLEPDGLVKNAIPGYENCDVTILGSPAMGATFADYLVTAKAGGKNAGIGGEGIESFLYVISGEVTVKNDDQEATLTEGGYIFSPEGNKIAFENKSGQDTKMYVYKRRYDRIEGYSAHTVVANVNDMEWVEYEGMDNCHIKDLLPAAGDFGDFPFPKGACQGVKRAGDRPFSAFASLRDADGSQADAFGPAGIGSHRTGRGRGHVFVS